VSNRLIKNSSYVNGGWINCEGLSAFAVLNPANQSCVAEVASASPADAVLAVDAADQALPSWRAKTAKQRAELLMVWFKLIVSNRDQLAELLTAEQGKPFTEAKSEVDYAASYIEWFAEEAKRVYGDTIPSPANDKRVIVIKQAVGVVSAITPWNFPLAMITRKAAPALAAGCTFVVKASEETLLSALALAELADEAGIPAGVFNVLVSEQSVEVGEVLVTDPRIGKFSFTGSTAVGKILLKKTADTVKKTSMELGGNAPFIVFDDADIDQAVAGLMLSKYRNAGQTCVCTNRVLVQAGIYDTFLEKLVLAVNKLEVGAGDAAQTDIGPLINAKAVKTVNRKVEQAVEQGAKLLSGGLMSSLGECFYPPSVLSEVESHMAIAQEEIFGPVTAVLRFETEGEAIAMANATRAGLAAYFYTQNLSRIWRVSEALEYGMVGINEAAISNPAAPFGGVKESGMGREGSKYGLDDYLEIKYLCLGGIKQNISSNERQY